MTGRTLLRILVVDDDEEIVENTRELLESQPISDAEDMATVATVTDFNEALVLLAQEEFDLIVLDVRDQGRIGQGLDPLDEGGSETTEADLGLQIFERVRATRFIPIIFYTALPNLVGDATAPGMPFVGLVSKTDGDPNGELRSRVREVFNSTLPAIHRALLELVERVIRDFMGEFVQEHWKELSTPPRKGDVAHLLLRRLALSLGDGAQVLTEQLSGEAISLDGDTVHPMRYYVIPPMPTRATGDILRTPRHGATPADEEPESDWYIVLTPACDLQPSHRKADFVMLARCLSFKKRAEYLKFLEKNPDPSQVLHKGSHDELKKLMSNNLGQTDRLSYLPAAWGIPDLLVDFQRVECIEYSQLDEYQCVASLDSPYAEWLVQKFVRYVGRIGVPDLDISAAIARLRSVLSG